MGDKSPKQKNRKAKQQKNVKDEKQRKVDAAASARVAVSTKK